MEDDSKLYAFRKTFKVFDECMTCNASAVYSLICDMSQLEDKKCFMSYENIGKDLNLGVRTVASIVKTLLYLELITCEIKPGKTCSLKPTKLTHKLVEFVKVKTKGKGKWEELTKRVEAMKPYDLNKADISQKLTKEEYDQMIKNTRI